MGTEDLSIMRHEYATDGLDETVAGDDPFDLFGRWLADAVAAGVSEPNAMALATADANGAPSVRIVLLKGLDRDGATFFTHYGSRKGEELAVNPRASVAMLWHPMHRQVRLEGAVTKLSAAESDSYYFLRPADSRISAAASPQSRSVADRATLESLWQAAKERGADQQRPAQWGGYRLDIESFEFWHGRTNRLHDRIRFRRTAGVWMRDRLAP